MSFVLDIELKDLANLGLYININESETFKTWADDVHDLRSFFEIFVDITTKECLSKGINLTSIKRIINKHPDGPKFIGDKSFYSFEFETEEDKFKFVLLYI